MRKLAALIVAIASIMALPADEQTPQRERVAGTVATVEGNRLAVTLAGGQTQTVMLTPDAAIYGGSNVGNAGAVSTVVTRDNPELRIVVPPLAAVFFVPQIE